MLKHHKINKQLALVREARVEDIGKAYEIARRCLTERYSEELFYGIYYSWPQGFLVAEVNGKVVGFIAGSKLNEIEGRVLLLAVDKPYRRIGIGGKLMDEFIRVCRMNRIRQVRLEVRVDNYEAIDFYKKRGFCIISVINNYYSDGTNAYVMLKLI